MRWERSTIWCQTERRGVVQKTAALKKTIELTGDGSEEKKGGG